MTIDDLDPAALAHEYRLARLRITELVLDELSTRGESIGSLPVHSCPAWTVRDLLAHVAGIASEIVSGNPPSGDSDAWVDAIVASRRQCTITELLDEWTASGPLFEGIAATTRRLAVPLSYDTVVHEHDLRHAMNRPGARDSSGVVSAMHVGVWLMTNDLKRHQYGSVRFHAGGRDWACGEGELRLTLDLDALNLHHPIWELLRLTGSRRSRRQMLDYAWQGDIDNGITAFLHMDLPVNDIDE